MANIPPITSLDQLRNVGFQSTQQSSITTKGGVNNSKIGSANHSTKVLVFPQSLDTIENTNTVIFQIMGIADVGVDLSNTQRTNGNASAAVDRVGGAVSDVFNNVLDTTKSIMKNGATESLSSLGSAGKEWASDMFQNAKPETIIKFGDSITKEDFGIKAKPKILDVVIKLPMPEDGLKTKYSMQYESRSLGLAGALVNTMASGASISSLIKQSKGPLMRALAGWTVGQLEDMAGNKSFGDIGATFEASTRTVLNPRKEILFQGVNYRVFNFDYTFIPSNKDECGTIIDIIQLFKSHMHPSLELQAFYMRYPSEFLISYHFNSTENQYIHSIGNCALQGLSVGYGRGGNFSTLLNGMPTVVNLHLSFIELEPIFRQRLEKEGF